jgi:hypothetical protein
VGRCSGRCYARGRRLAKFWHSSALAADLGEGDVAILNYAYALEQLEAAFYTKVTNDPFEGATRQEAKTFAEIRDHEVAHREFFKKAIGEHAVSDIERDFSKVNFNSRASVRKPGDSRL